MRLSVLRILLPALTSLACCLPGQLHAAPRSWTGNAGTTSWNHTLNWNPIGVILTSDNIFIGDLNQNADVRLMQSQTIDSLTLMNNASFDQVAGTLHINDGLTLEDNSLFETEGFNSEDVRILDNATLSLEFVNGAYKADDSVQIGSGATLRLQAGTKLEAAANSGRAFIIDGTVAPRGGIGTIRAPSGGLIDLDGNNGNGHLNIVADGAGGAGLIVDGPIADDFDGVIDILGPFGASLEMTQPWKLAPSGVLNFETGVVRGAQANLAGRVNVRGSRSFQADAVIERGQFRSVDGQLGQMVFSESVEYQGGPASPITVDGVSLFSSGPAAINGASVLFDATGGNPDGAVQFADTTAIDTGWFEGDGIVNFLGATTIGNQLTLDGVTTAAVDLLQLDGTLNLLGAGVTTTSTEFVKDATATLNLAGGEFVVRGDATMNSSYAYGGTSNALGERTTFSVVDGGNTEVTYSWNVGNAAGTYATTNVSGVSPDGTRRSTLRGTGGGGGADLIAGDYGWGSFYVSDGGWAGLRDDVQIGRRAGSIGLVSVDGVHDTGSELIRSELDVTGSGSSSWMDVGRGGLGTLGVANGGLVNVAGHVIAGALVGSEGHIYLYNESEGFPAHLDVGGNVTIGSGGTGGLHIFDGGQLTASHLGVGSTGSINMSGGLVDVQGFLKNSAAPFTLTGGNFRVTGGDATFNSSFAFGGQNPAGGSTEFVDGADATVTYSWNIAKDAGSWAQTNVVGANADGSRRSKLRSTGSGGGADLTVGDAGNGYMYIGDGGLVSLADDAILANQAGSFGSITVMGVNENGASPLQSELQVNRRGAESNLYVGNHGDGDLNILFGGLTRVGGSLHVARNPGSIGDVYVSGEQAGHQSELDVVGNIVAGTNLVNGQEGVGGIHLEPGGKITASEMILNAAGTFNMTGGRLTLDKLDLSNGGTANFAAGEVDVDVVDGDVDFGNVTLLPGNSPGIMDITGSASLSDETTFLMEIGGTGSSDFDKLFVYDEVNLDGTLQIELIDLGSGTYVPSLGDRFTFVVSDLMVNGTFDEIISDPLPAGLAWDLHSEPEELQLRVVQSITPIAPVDFDLDGDIDEYDLAKWEADYGGPGSDADGDGLSAGSDFLAWQRQYTGSASPALAATAVPEPAGLALMLMGLIGILAVERKK